MTPGVTAAVPDVCHTAGCLGVSAALCRQAPA